MTGCVKAFVGQVLVPARSLGALQPVQGDGLPGRAGSSLLAGLLHAAGLQIKPGGPGPSTMCLRVVTRTFKGVWKWFGGSGLHALPELTRDAASRPCLWDSKQAAPLGPPQSVCERPPAGQRCGGLRRSDHRHALPPSGQTPATVRQASTASQRLTSFLCLAINLDFNKQDGCSCGYKYNHTGLFGSTYHMAAP